MFKKNLLIVLSLLAFATLNAQIIIDNTPTPTDLVTNTLIGPGLVTSNITFTGNSQQIGHFTSNGSNIGLDSGVVMSSGIVGSFVPPGNPSTDFGGAGDADVLATAQSVTSNPAVGSINSTFDAAVLEFDFVPTGDVVIFRFVFASEEYLTYVNTQYNDAFGFYISGPDPAGGNYNVQNLALVPGTTEPITISTIHPGLNPQYYIGTPIGHTYNGFSVPIEIRFDVICDSTYHFKFAVADCQDGILDTGVLLEGGSFQAVPVDLSLETNIDPSLFGDSVIFEGCGTDASFVFSRPSCQSGDSLYVEVSVAGTAINGTDYSTIPDSVLFLPGETEVIIPFSAFQDGVFEGYEDVIVTVVNILPNGDTITTTGTIWLYDQPNVSIVAADTAIFCFEDSIEVFSQGFDGVPPYSYSWNFNSDTTSNTFVPADANGVFDYYVTITDFCGFTDTDTLTVTINQTITIDTLIQYPASACNPDGAISATASGLVGTPFYNWTGPGAGNPNFIDATVWQDIPAGWYYFTVTDDVCSANDSILVEIENPPIAEFSPSITSGCAPLNVSFTNTSQNATIFEWDFGNGNVVTVNNMSNQSFSFVSSENVMLVASDAAGCSDTAYISIQVSPCGCTDPNATNFNPLASIEDGSCLYPTPIVIAPNVFTPNGDGANEIFELDIKYSDNVELTILNRWGNVMRITDGPNPIWDGTTESGVEAGDGTYFYKYIAIGFDGTEVEGHGFVQLIRN